MSGRPRDALGRPLARDAVGVEPEPEVPRTPGQALQRAQELLDAGRAFSAHEVLELAWKSAPAAEREFWRGLAQLCVAVVHAQRGNEVGSRALARRGADNVRSHDGDLHGVDVDAVLAWAESGAMEGLRLI